MDTWGGLVIGGAVHGRTVRARVRTAGTGSGGL
jgi:hypothetical protein